MQQFLSNPSYVRWRWLRHGVELFRRGFLRWKESNHAKSRVLVGVYGPTQVGKSTLILKILGIRSEKFAYLSEALRGSRPKGHSATITATIYQKSSDERFCITIPDEECKYYETLADLEKGMKYVREKAEAGEIDSSKPVIIKIGKSYFDNDELGQRKQDIEIIDLPGDDSRDRRDTDQVERCLKAFLPQCRICLLLEITGNMTALTQIRREHVCDWRLFPGYFRIVLTRAVTGSSIKEKIRSGKINSVTSFNEAFRGQFVRCCEDMPQIKLYPLEFGDSWASLKNNEVNIYKTALPWVDKNFKELIDDLGAINSPDNMVNQIRDMETYIRNKSEVEYKQFLNKISDIEEIIVKTGQEIELEINNQCGLETNLKYLNESIKKVTDSIPTLLSKEDILDRVSYFNYDSAQDRSVTWIKAQFYSELDYIKNYYMLNFGKWKNIITWHAKLHDVIPPELEYTFYETDVDFLNKYPVDWYLFEDNFNKDCQQCIQQLIAANKKAIGDFGAYKDINENIIAYFKIIKDNVTSKIGQSQDKQNKLEIELMTLAQVKNELTLERNKAKAEWESDYARVAEFDNYLKKAFVAEIQRTIKILSSPSMPIEQIWFYHQYLNMISQDAGRIINRENA